jgi:hypothetical protein
VCRVQASPVAAAADSTTIDAEGADLEFEFEGSGSWV